MDMATWQIGWIVIGTGIGVFATLGLSRALWLRKKAATPTHKELEDKHG